MAGLSIFLLGPFQAALDGQTVTGFESNKVRALLAYLAVEAERPHARETLAGLLWPDYTHTSALNNLRSVLANLRRTIGDRQAQPPYLLISRNTLQFNAASDHMLDYERLQNLPQRSIEQLEAAVAGCHGVFMEGFSLEDSPPFEEWLLYRREQANQQLLQALLCLAAHYEACGDYGRAAEYARRALALEPWHEEAQRQRMRALFFSGQRSSALAQYEAFSRLLMQELGVDPARETSEMAESIRSGKLAPQIVISDDGRGNSPPAPGEPPFKGLNFFEEADADLFFGREKLTAQMLGLVEDCFEDQTTGYRLVTVIGASGSGKSSVVRAGLVPALKSEGHSFPGSIVVLTPTARPLEALALALTAGNGSLAGTADLMDDLARDPRSLHLAAARLAYQNGASLLLIVDQFEELFSQCRDEDAREAFVDNLLYAAQMPGALAVIVALRADFYAQCAPYENLRQALCARQLYIGAMGPEEMRLAVTEPARQGKWSFEPGLVGLLLRDAGEEPGALPLLSHALLETWKHRSGRTMTLAGYQEAGGVQGAIARTAEMVYQRLSAEQQAVARDIFLRLAELGESGAGEMQAALYTRRRADLAELFPRPEARDEVQTVLNKLADARLITLSQETAEVAHEALIREWDRLREWLDENREAIRLQRQLTAAAQDWERLQRDSGALYRGARLAQATEWAASFPGRLSEQEALFLEASLAAEQAQQAAEEERRLRELQSAQTVAEEQRLRAEAEAQRAQEQADSAGKLRRRAVLLALAAGAMAILLLAAFGLAQLANRSAQEAQELTRLATSRELAAAAVNNLSLDPERSVLLALEALETADTMEARNALHQSLPELHLLRTIPAHEGGAPGVAFSPDGKQLASLGVDAVTKIWDAASGQLLQEMPGDAGEIGYNLVYSPDGTRLAATFISHVLLWDVASGERLLTFPGETTGTVRRLAFSPDGKRLAVASMDGLPRVWDVTGSALPEAPLLSLTGHDQPCEAITFSPDGRRLATGDFGGNIRIWDAQDGRELLSFDHGGSIHNLAFSPDGTRLAVASDNAILGVWDPATGESLLSLPLQSGIYDVAYMPDGKRLAAAHQDGTTTMWDSSSGQQLLNLAGHVSTVITLAANPDNRTLASGGYDGTLKLWDTSPGRELLTIAAHDDQVYDVAYSPDGLRLASAGFDGKARLWDPASGLLARSLPPENASAGLSSLDLSSDGKLMALGGWDGMLYLVDLTTDQLMLSLPAHAGAITGMELSTDGERLASGGWDGTARIWDVATSEELLTLYSKDDNGVPWAISGLDFSPDGRFLFTGGDDDFVHQWDAVTGEEILRFDGGGLDLYGVAVSPDGNLLAAGRQDGAVLLWDIASGEQLQQLAAHAGLILRLAFSHDGSKLASVGFDSLAKVWDVASGEQLATLYGATGNVFGADFSPDDKHVATAVGDGTVRLYTLDMEELISLARERVTRDLTDEECRVYLHTEICLVEQ